MKNKLKGKKEEIDSVIKMSGPVLVELFLGTMFGMIDMMMLGRIANANEAVASIAAVGITNQLVFIVLSLVQALNVGGTAMVARYIGSKKFERIESVVKHIVLLTQVLIVIPVLFFSLVFSKEIMSVLGARTDTITLGLGYFRVTIIGLIFNSFNFSIYAILRGTGDTKTPMSVSIKANFLNVIGNAVLIYGLLGFPRLGVMGAGLSTTLSQVFASILLIRKILKKETIVDLKPGFKFQSYIMFNLIKIGVPASFEQIVIRVGILIFTRIVASLGTVSYATHQICLNILNLSFTPGQALGIASSTLTGQSLGAGKKDKAESYTDICEILGIILSIILAIILFVFGESIARLYSKDPKVIKDAARLLKIIAFIQPLQTSQMILAGSLRGAGDTVWPLIAMFVTVLFLRVLLAMIFVIKLEMGLEGAWFAMLIDQAVRWGIIKLRYRTGRWKYISLR